MPISPEFLEAVLPKVARNVLGPKTEAAGKSAIPALRPFDAQTNFTTSPPMALARDLPRVKQSQSQCVAANIEAVLRYHGVDNYEQGEIYKAIRSRQRPWDNFWQSGLSHDAAQDWLASENIRSTAGRADHKDPIKWLSQRVNSLDTPVIVSVDTGFLNAENHSVIVTQVKDGYVYFVDPSGLPWIKPRFEGGATHRQSIKDFLTDWGSMGYGYLVIHP